MGRHKRGRLAVEAARAAALISLRLGAEVRRTRARRRLTLERLAGRVGISASRLGQLERGAGSEAPLSVWVALGEALGRPLRAELVRDAGAEPADAGHLRIQELVLRLGRRAGYGRTFELATRPADPMRSADVGLRDDRARRLLLVECWNTLGDIGAAARATSRKVSEAEAYAVAVAGEGALYSVHACWVLRDTRTNRGLVQRYPEVFAARFPGSSQAWLRALTVGDPPPPAAGLVWCDTRASRLFAWRRRR